MDAPPTQAGSQSLERGLQILSLFDERTRRLTASEAALRLGLHRSTASRLMAALQRHRLLEYDEHQGGYALGLGLVSMAGHVLQRFPVRDSARDVARRIRDRIESNVYLGVLDGDEVVYIDQVSAPHVRLNVDWVGQRQALAAGVTGAVLLAYQRPEVVAELLREAQAEPVAGAPLLDAELLAEVRRLGFLARYADPLDDHAVVAAPIRDRRGDVVAALCISSPRSRVDPAGFERVLVPAARQGAKRISERLHG